MKRDDIIRMAQVANRYANNQTGDIYEWQFIRDERFAALVRADEREQCAKVCEEQAESPALAPLEKYRASFIADTIRARGKQNDL